MSNVLRHLARRHLTLLAVTTVVLASFEFIIPGIIVTLDMPNLIGGVLAMLPPALGTALGEQFFGGLTADGLLAFGWNHPIAHAAGTAIAVVLGARAVAGEADLGTLELTLAQPISRTRYLLAHVVFAGIALLLLCTAGMCAMVAGTHVFGGAALPFPRIAPIAANYFLLLLSLFAVTLLTSVYAREAAHALGAGFIVAVVSFLVFTVAMLWPRAAWLGPFTLHAYYEPREVLMSGRIATLSIIVLVVWSAACLLLAFVHFNRRDVP
jgi:ABC-2 type transport system permease protein